MKNLINRQEAINALANGKTVKHVPTGIIYKVLDGELGSNRSRVGFGEEGRAYTITKDYKGHLFTDQSQSPSFPVVASQVKELIKLNGAPTKTGKTIKQNLIQALSDAFGVRDQVFKVEPVQLFRLGNFVLPVKGTTEDLSEYFIDADGDMYSKNDDTYFTKYGMILTKLSNGALDSSGNIVNSFRAKSGNKVTIARKKLIEMRNAGLLEDVTMLPKSVHMVHVPSGEEIVTDSFAV